MISRKSVCYDEVFQLILTFRLCFMGQHQELADEGTNVRFVISKCFISTKVRYGVFSGVMFSSLPRYEEYSFNTSTLRYL